MSRLLSSLAIMMLWNSANAAQPCGADASVDAFKRATTGVVSELPTLDGDVDKCFPKEKPKYIAGAHTYLRDILGGYRQANADISSAFADLARGQDASFTSAVPKLVANITRVNTPLFDNDSDLKNYGFTISDKMEGGRYKYPECNSQNNDGPERRWSKVYSGVISVRNSLAGLTNTANCLKKSSN